MENSLANQGVDRIVALSASLLWFFVLNVGYNDALIPTPFTVFTFVLMCVAFLLS